MFEDSLLGNKPRDWKSTGLSALVHLALALGLIVLPLVFYDDMTTQVLQASELKLPLPPPGPAVIKTVPVPGSARPKPTPTNPGGLTTPTEIPKIIVANDLPTIGDSPTGPGIVGGVPNGTPGGPGILLGDLFGPTKQAAPPPPPPPPVAPPPPPPPAQVQRIGGDVAQANLIDQVKPVYPALAKAARVQDYVMLQATINKEGMIENLKVLHGHPLLNDAAISAVKQWRYKPQMLNGQPIEVITTITVNFSFAQ